MSKVQNIKPNPLVQLLSVEGILESALMQVRDIKKAITNDRKIAKQRGDINPSAGPKGRKMSREEAKDAALERRLNNANRIIKRASVAAEAR